MLSKNPFQFLLKKLNLDKVEMEIRSLDDSKSSYGDMIPQK